MKLIKPLGITFALSLLFAGCSPTTNSIPLNSSTSTPVESPVIRQTDQPSQSELPTANNWKTYTNVLSGYSIKYPSGWKAIDLTSKVATKDSLIKSWVAFAPEDLAATATEDSPIYIAEGVGRTYENRIELAEGYEGYGGANITKKNVKIAGIESTEYEGKTNNLSTPNGQLNKYVIINKQGVFMIRANDPYIKILNEMLSTLMFTK